MNVYCTECKTEHEIMQDLGTELHVAPCKCFAADLAALNARVEELETSNREWLESYDITMPCGHKNRYLLTNGRGELEKDYRGDCVCVICQLEKADNEIEAALKGAE